jgi:hypothetical protein
MRNLGKILLIYFSLLNFSSCSKMLYVAEQGVGQISLIHRGVPNENILNSVKYDKKIKQKIQKIEHFKEYFFKYFNKKPTEIYTKTTFLKSKAVTYLVIASPFYTITPKLECFPFVGCFPYLGFFKQQSALEYSANLKKEGLVTHVRPVYAYSTLGHFQDTILSSFFHYEDFELAELVFHELFHTIFFIKDEVEFNENLANFMGVELAMNYFNWKPSERQEKEKKELAIRELSHHMVTLVGELNQLYLKNGGEKISALYAEEILSNFLGDRFIPEIQNKCNKLSLANKDCFPLRTKWNNASFSAYLTYQKDMKEIEKLSARIGTDLRKFLEYIEQELNNFKDLSSEEKKKGFSTWLFSR